MARQGDIKARSFARRAARRGTTCTLTRSLNQTYDPVADEVSADPPTTVTVKGFFVEMKEGRFQQTDTSSKTRLFQIPALNLSFTPVAGLLATIAGQQFRVADSKPYTADDVLHSHLLNLESA